LILSHFDIFAPAYKDDNDEPLQKPVYNCLIT